MRMIHLAAAVAALACAACVPSTPEARIAAQPALFDGLPARQQELVRQGRIDKGMGTDAVYLAWGRPSREYEGSDGATPTMRWDYVGTTPVHGSGFHGGYGFGYGRYGRYGRYGGGPFFGHGIGSDVAFVPYRRATVLFREGRVSSWERSR